jgi:hypothetical protein
MKNFKDPSKTSVKSIFPPFRFCGRRVLDGNIRAPPQKPLRLAPKAGTAAGVGATR